MDAVIALAIGGSVIVGVVAIAPTVKMAVDMAPFLYANTRCSSRAGLMLKKKGYEQLVGSASMRELYSILEETYYASMVDNVKSVGEFSSKLEEDLHENYEWMISFLPKKVAPIVEAMKLRFTINDLKSALNSCISGNSPQGLKYIEDEDLKIRLESCNDVESFIAALKDTEFEHIVSSNPNVTPEYLANQLDIYYYKKVLEQIKVLKDKDGAKVFLDYWRKSIDLVNIRIALRRIKGITELDFIEGGFISPKELQSVSDNMQLESILSKSLYKEFLKGSDPLEIESSIYNAFMKESSSVNAKHALKAGTIVKYLIDKELEVRNLNIVTKLKSESYKSDDIWKHLVVRD
ncbi:MAG: V-type ATPase subunit [Nanobdellota archaeon]